VSEICILLVGNTDRSEFRPARAALETLGQVTSRPDAEAAADLLSSGQVTADVIIIAQSYPGQFSHEAIDRLRRLAPLARVLGLLGSWCEGEMRSGDPWPAPIRVYWHQWLPRCERELGRMHRGQGSGWGLPITATDEERLLLELVEPSAGQVQRDASGLSPMMGRQGLVAIHSRSYEMQDWLSAVLRGRGLSTVWLRPPRPARVEGAAAAIFDGSDCRGEELDELKHLRDMLGPPPADNTAPIIALLDFPRIEDYHRVLGAGATAMVSKPLIVEDLFRELDRVLALWEATGVVD
jgi:DNA-binding NarL/FixJ family response regulator